ncbi:tyrosine-type recombinase/integrase [Acinetobacter portensis]|uniref:Tyrosine-type recombinase/integrase n=2 Tax=Acinetobacter TaxID=469 RepID=A0ABY4K155_9GAMM|nr:tyrosine-type recombinase/integrase [Acinetobacter portensis]MCK7609212.1 tyrosine-type recombinase/integrase [Acinetobacter portensis]MCK7639989.1 tyrosine-type recombinase/integrase [Acinetobacter portensis]UPO24916.1 tyrosine-type recombinase/integrase [Acinetobacter portensis]
MNRYLEQLLEWINQNENIEEQQLIQALFLLRAHYSLAGIVVICQRIFTLIADDELLEFRDELNTLKIISRLQDSSKYPHFFSETTDRNKHKLTPLRPYTGDSGICDLLLIQAGISRNNQSFDTVITWFLEQIFYFQKNVHTLEIYSNYLSGDGSIKLKAQKGSRVYNAFLAIRQLGDPSHEDILERVKDLVTQNEPEQWIRSMSAGSEDKRLNEVFYALKLFLSQIWDNNRLKNKKKRREFLHRIGLKHQKLILQRYGSLSIAIQPLQEIDEIHRGLISEVFADDEIEEDETPLEPLFTLFLAEQSDLIRGLYASKSIFQHVEATNVGLVWTKWRLSLNSIQQVLRLCQPSPADSSLILRAKLALILSLLTGRSVTELTAPCFSQNTDQNNIAIQYDHTLSAYVLSVLAGTPTLKTKPEDSKFHVPWTKKLHLVLPSELNDLVNQVKNLGIRTRQLAVEREVRRLINSVPQELEVSLKSIRDILPRLLYEHSQGDLAVVKAVTNESGRNYDNLIHYASFEQKKLEQLWSDCLRTIKIDIPQYIHTSSERVGSPIGIKIVEIQNEITRIKNRINQAYEQKNWQVLFDNLTLYTALWMNLATAGRGIKQPFPKWISQPGWALIQDKHHQDESTDRYVPLTPALIKQIQGLRGLMRMLGEQVEPRVDLSSYALQLFDSHQIEGLVRNWARKLVRSDHNQLPGRFKDAGLGHWIRGRHPWDMLSVFPVSVFKQQWLDVQENLQKQLGFEYFEGFDFFKIKHIPTFVLTQETKTAQVETKPRIQYSENDVKEWLKNSEYESYFPLIFEENPEPQVALELGHLLASHLAKNTNIDLPEAIKAYCAYIRDKTKIPLFVQLPQKANRTWLTSENSFSTWCYIEQNLLDLIQKDLEHLPEHQNCDVEIGRLLVVLSMYSQLCRVSHLQAMLEFIASDQHIVAMGNSRLVELTVNNDRSVTKIRRTVLLSPYVSTLILVGRQYLQPRLKEILAQPRNQQRTAWQKCFNTYLKQIGVKSTLSLAQWLKALQQNVMLNSTPLIAGYISGQVLTEDLSINELLRLSEYEKLTTNLDSTEPESEIEIDDEQLHLSDILAMIQQLKGESRSSIWLKQLANNETNHYSVNLLTCFVRWLILRCDAEELSLQNRNMIHLHLAIVSAGILGFSEDLTKDSQIDEDVFQKWMELTQEHFPHRKHLAAWNRFRDFLIQLNDNRIKLHKRTAHQASAKVFSKNEVQQIVQILQSVESGVNDAALRLEIQRHFRLSAAMGVRRSETLHLRPLDIDEDMLRIRPYGEHQLKTLGSERVVPMNLLSQTIQNGLDDIYKNKKYSILMSDENSEHRPFFDQISKILKKVTGDVDLSLHHLRHTFASTYALKCLQTVVDFKALTLELPWLQTWMPSNEQFNTLVGNEGQVGQGIKAISRVLGHLHESTTLKHYVHILFLATYAYSMQQQQPNLHTAFFKRVMSRSNLFRHFQAIHQQDGNLKYELRDTIEKYVLKKRQSQRWVIYAQKIENSTGKVIKHELFQKFEDVERYLISGRGQPRVDIESWKRALITMANIPSGKRGSNIGRHPLSTQGKLARLPELLSAVDFNSAQEILERFDYLEQNQSETYNWLIKKWLYESNVTKVLMHFTAEDEPMLSILTEHQFFPIVMKHNKYDYFRIMSQQASLSAVRWVLAWLSVRYLVIRDHKFSV